MAPLQADAHPLVTAAFACVLPVCAQIGMWSNASLSIYGFQLKSDMVNFSLNVSGNFHLRGSLSNETPHLPPSSICERFLKTTGLNLGHKNLVFRMCSLSLQRSIYLVT